MKFCVSFRREENRKLVKKLKDSFRKARPPSVGISALAGARSRVSQVEEHRAERLDNILKAEKRNASPPLGALKAKEEREENARQVTERRETALQRDQEAALLSELHRI